MSKLITINLSYYNQNKNILMKHIQYWHSFPQDVKDLMTFFIIDDGSKINISDLITNDDIAGLDVRIFRVKVDLLCNIGGVRNLGATECKTPWYMIIDMDTLINTKMATELIKIAQESTGKNHTFKFNRIVVDNPSHVKHMQPHPAVCLIRLHDYWVIGGCDEDFVGNYGYTDPHFWHRSAGKIKLMTKMDVFLEYDDEGESPINRDTRVNAELFESKKQKQNWSTNFLRFPYEEIPFGKIVTPFKICFVATYIGPADLADFSNNFEKADGCDYLMFTNLNNIKIKKGWEAITIDLEEFKYLNNAVKVSRYFKFMVHEYLKKIGRDYDFIFYCDAYRYPRHTINWQQVCKKFETSESGIMQYTHVCCGPKISVNYEIDFIGNVKKDTKENMTKTREYLKAIDSNVDINKHQYFENSIIGFHLKNENAINQCNEFWKYYVNCPTYRDQPLWNFLYLKNNKKPYVEDNLPKMYEGNMRFQRQVEDYTKANVVVPPK